MTLIRLTTDAGPQWINPGHISRVYPGPKQTVVHMQPGTSTLSVHETAEQIAAAVNTLDVEYQEQR